MDERRSTQKLHGYVFWEGESFSVVLGTGFEPALT